MLRRVPCLLALLALAATVGSRPAAAARVVSLNLCTDQLLVLLAPEQAVGLTPLARDPALSAVAAEASRLPVVRPDAEAVLRRHPDLVLAGRYGAQTTLALLRATGAAVLVLPPANDFPAIRTQTLALAARLGVPGRGAALVGAMAAELAAARPRQPGPRALFWGPRGWTAGPGTLADAVLRAAGLRDIGTGGPVGLEKLVAHPPDLLVEPASPGFPSLATALFDHPALQRIPRRRLPPALTLCGTPLTARAVTLLAAPGAGEPHAR